MLTFERLEKCLRGNKLRDIEVTAKEYINHRSKAAVEVLGEVEGLDREFTFGVDSLVEF